MGHFHIELIHFRIVEGGVDFDVSENALDLFYWHPFVYSHCSEGSAELPGVLKRNGGNLTCSNFCHAFFNFA